MGFFEGLRPVLNGSDAVHFDEPSKTHLNLSSIEIDLKQRDPVAIVFAHELTHETEGTEEYFELTRSLDEMEKEGLISDPNHYWGTEHYARLVESLLSRDGNSLKNVASRSPSTVKYLYDQLATGLAGNSDALKNNKAMRNLGKAIDVAKYKTQTLEYDPYGLEKDNWEYTDEERENGPLYRPAMASAWPGGKPRFKKIGNGRTENRQFRKEQQSSYGLNDDELRLLSAAVERVDDVDESFKEKLIQLPGMDKLKDASVDDIWNLYNAYENGELNQTVPAQVEQSVETEAKVEAEPLVERIISRL